MFSSDVVCTDDFVSSLPATSQALYFQLGMSADDDGFVANPKMIARCFYGGTKFLKILIDRNYLIPFSTGVIVITHWKLSNKVPQDRYNPTKFIEELKQVVSEKDVYINKKE